MQHFRYHFWRFVLNVQRWIEHFFNDWIQHFRHQTIVSVFIRFSVSYSLFDIFKFRQCIWLFRNQMQHFWPHFFDVSFWTFNVESSIFSTTEFSIFVNRQLSMYLIVLALSTAVLIFSNFVNAFDRFEIECSFLTFHREWRCFCNEHFAIKQIRQCI